MSEVDVSFNLNTLISGIGIAAQLFGARQSARAAYDGARAQRAALEYNAQLAEDQAQQIEARVRDAYIRGEQTAIKAGLRTAQLRGTQRARFAARGIALDEGSALNILNDTDYFHDLDLATIKDNTEREAWMLRQGARNKRLEAAMHRATAAQISPRDAAVSSLLGSGARVADSWYRLARREPSPLVSTERAPRLDDWSGSHY